MPKPITGVYRRGSSGRYQWRIKTPSDLRSVYRGPWACRVSLATSDLREANEKAAQLWAYWTGRFEEQRKALNPQRAEQITPELAQVLAQRVGASILARDEDLRTDPELARTLLVAVRQAVPGKLLIGPGPAPLPDWATDPIDPLDGLPDDLASELAELNFQIDSQAAMQFATQRIRPVLPIAQEEAAKLGITFDANTPGAREMLRECLRAYRKAWQSVHSRDVGEVIETPQPSSLPSTKPQDAPKKLRDVFERWKVVKKRSKDAVRACERALIQFEQSTGNPPLHAITRAQGDEFRAWLQQQGLSSKTAHDRITSVKSLLKYASRDLEWLTRQPWEGIDIEWRTENPRAPWTDEELQAFFSLPLFQKYELPQGNFRSGGDAAYWISLLGLYTGARVGELAQLRVQDVEQAKAGAFIRITEEAEGATVKTQAGIRRVPIHRELVRLGFMQYVEAMRKAGAVSLWPNYRLREGKPGGYFSDWINPFHKAATGNPKAPVFHELRHTVRTALHSAKVDRATIGLLIGHDTGLSAAELTYTHVSDADLRAAIETLRYPAVKLKKAYKG